MTKFTERRPTRLDALAGVHVGIGTRWIHDDPANVCVTVRRQHRRFETAVSCELNSRLIEWKRRKAAHDDRD